MSEEQGQVGVGYSQSQMSGSSSTGVDQTQQDSAENGREKKRRLEDERSGERGCVGPCISAPECNCGPNDPT